MLNSITKNNKSITDFHVKMLISSLKKMLIFYKTILCFTHNAVFLLY